MAIILESNGIKRQILVDMSTVKSGTASNGHEWMNVEVRNPDNDKEHKRFFVADDNIAEAKRIQGYGIITGFAVRAGSKNVNGRWEDNYSVTVKLSASGAQKQTVQSGASAFANALGNDFMPVPDNLEQDGLPFA